jgi:hypothetical protein
MTIGATKRHTCKRNALKRPTESISIFFSDNRMQLISQIAKRSTAMCCAAVLTISLEAQAAAEISVWTVPLNKKVTALRSIAVAGFARDDGLVFSRVLESEIASVTVTDRQQEKQNPLQVIGVDRTQPLSVAKTEPSDLGKIAARLGADAILVGEILSANANTSPFRSDKDVCAKTEPVRVGGMVVSERCVSFRKADSSCVKVTGVVSIRYRLIATNGEVLLNRVAEGKAEDFGCDGQRVSMPSTPKTESKPSGFSLSSLLGGINEAVGAITGSTSATRPTGTLEGPVSTPQAIGAEAFKVAADRIQEHVVPRQKKIKIDWMQDSSGIAQRAAKDSFASALEFAKGNRPDRACRIFREIYVSEQSSIDLHYNAGICDEMDGLLDQALKKYRIADESLKKPDPNISAALKRVEEQVGKVDTIAGQREDLAAGAGVDRGRGGAALAPIQRAGDAVDPNVRALTKIERRVALVIGNATYRNIAALRNPINDADAIEASLKQNGFTTFSGRNLNNQQTWQLINRFKAAIKPGDVALVYFAGHGISLENTSFLLPIDFLTSYAKGVNEARGKAINIETDLVPALQKQQARLTIFWVDACREIPQFTSSERGLSRGLPEPKLAKGLLISYATGTGQTAADGAEKNGVYTEKLLQALGTPNVSLRELMGWVKNAVSTATGGAQIPAVYDESVGDFYFKVD